MRCPQCNTRMTVVDSRMMENSITRRRHHCSKCNKNYTTIETIVEDAQWGDFTRNVSKFKGFNQDQVLRTMARNAVVKGRAMSTVTGGIYESEEEALKDTMKELKHLMEDHEDA